MSQSTPPKAKRQRARKGQGALLRTDILAATAAILTERGDAGSVSIRAVAERSGISTAAIYLHFSDRDQLLAEVCGAVFSELDQALAEAATGAPGPLEALRRQGVAYIRFALERPEQYRFVLMGRTEEIHRPDPAQLATSGAFANLLETVRECQRQGVFAQGDPVPLALALWSSAHGLASLLISAPFMAWPPWEEIADLVVGVATRGLAQQRPKPGDQ